jgi:NADPH:quinone reductase-like Zn-dependent oxidoreductase
MRAVVYDTYGPPDVVQITEIATPVPADNEVLVKVHATTVASADWRARTLAVPTGFGLFARLFFGITGPRQPILGTELAGEIVSVGKDVRKFKVGDQVFAFTGAGMGCHVEYKCFPETGPIARKPANLTYAQAASISFGGMATMSFLRRATIKKGDRMLVNGASGAVGTAAVQLAKHFGAHVTGVCSSSNVDLVRALGADQVIDYTNADFTTTGETYDIILDTAGTAPFSRCKGSLKEGGRLLLVLGTLPDLLTSPWVAMTSSKKVVAGPQSAPQEDLHFLARLAESGELRPVIDRQYSLDQIASAHRHVDTGHKRGSVVVTMQ